MMLLVCKQYRKKNLRKIKCLHTSKIISNPHNKPNFSSGSLLGAVFDGIKKRTQKDATHARNTHACPYLSSQVLKIELVDGL